MKLAVFDFDGILFGLFKVMRKNKFQLKILTTKRRTKIKQRQKRYKNH